MSKVRIGLIGASYFARCYHYTSLREFNDVELVALSEPMVSLREEVARELEIPRQYATYTEMIEKVPVDAVYAVMAPIRSYEVLSYCISKGLPTFMEKPVVTSFQQADELAEAAAKSGALSMVGFNRRFMPALVEAKRRVRASGPINHCVATYYKHQSDATYYDGEIDFIRCDVIHAVDALRWIGGDVAKVTSIVSTHCDAKRFNSVNAVMTFESGATGALMANWATAARVHTFELHTLDCSAFVDPSGTTTLLQADSKQDIHLNAAEVAGSNEHRIVYGFQAENRHFVDCVKTGRQPETNIAEAAKTHALIDEILRQAI